jgi:uncharacterized protein (TIGR02117 family)
VAVGKAIINRPLIMNRKVNIPITPTKIKNRFFIFSGLILWLAVLLTGCFPAKEGLYPPDDKEENPTTVYITKRSWHTGILLKNKALDTLFADLYNNYPDAEYLNISWGDKKYFMADKGTVGLALRAALLPTKSVVHVDGYSRLPEWYIKSDQLAEVHLSENGFSKMVRFIRNSFARDSAGNLIALRSSPEAMSSFYLSDITYWGTRTCNVWTAKALRKSGFPVNPFIALTAGNLMKQVRKQE